MSIGKVLGLVFGLIALTLGAVLYVCWLARCKHELIAAVHVASGEVYKVCRCGERWDR
jgi:hypothetical protein